MFIPGIFSFFTNKNAKKVFKDFIRKNFLWTHTLVLTENIVDADLFHKTYFTTNIQ